MHLNDDPDEYNRAMMQTQKMISEKAMNNTL